MQQTQSKERILQKFPPQWKLDFCLLLLAPRLSAGTLCDLYAKDIEGQKKEQRGPQRGLIQSHMLGVVVLQPSSLWLQALMHFLYTALPSALRLPHMSPFL
jgi:hypothetical protein